MQVCGQGRWSEEGIHYVCEKLDLRDGMLVCTFSDRLTEAEYF